MVCIFVVCAGQGHRAMKPKGFEALLFLFI